VNNKNKIKAMKQTRRTTKDAARRSMYGKNDQNSRVWWDGKKNIAE
jgi:hypothetical protein